MCRKDSCFWNEDESLNANETFAVSRETVKVPTNRPKKATIEKTPIPVAETPAPIAMAILLNRLITNLVSNIRCSIAQKIHLSDVSQ